MATTRRRMVRLRPVIPAQEVQQQRQIRKWRDRLASERAALARWMSRLRRAFHAVERLHTTIARLEKSLTRLEET
jgi:hypothetical protein